MDVIMVTDKGMDIITNRIIGAGIEPKFIAWGVGTTPPVAGNTTLESASAEARTTGTSSRVTTNVANDSYSVVGTITCTGTAKAITEVGLLDASTSGNLFLRGTFSPINVSISDSVEFTIKVIFDQA